MASYEKIIKRIIDGFSEGLSPLKTIVQNQEILIIQNKKTIELLDSINNKLDCSPEAEPTSPEE